MEPLGYFRCENFEAAIKRAMLSRETNKMPVESHFREVTKMAIAGVVRREVRDYKLTRYFFSVCLLSHLLMQFGNLLICSLGILEFDDILTYTVDHILWSTVYVRT